MIKRDYQGFITDIHRFRPLVTMIATVLVLSPSIFEVFEQSLTMLAFLLRLAETLCFMGVLVWSASAVFIRYARHQAQVESQLRRTGRAKS